MTDEDIIEFYGGPAKLALMLELKGDGQIQRVCNWKRRGIPPGIKVQYQKIFLRSDWPDLDESRATA